MSNLYNYKAKIVRVVDGDTVDAMIDLGFSIHCKQRIRQDRVWQHVFLRRRLAAGAGCRCCSGPHADVARG